MLLLVQRQHFLQGSHAQTHLLWLLLSLMLLLLPPCVRTFSSACYTSLPLSVKFSCFVKLIMLIELTPISPTFFPENVLHDCPHHWVSCVEVVPDSWRQKMESDLSRVISPLDAKLHRGDHVENVLSTLIRMFCFPIQLKRLHTCWPFFPSRFRMHNYVQ